MMKWAGHIPAGLVYKEPVCTLDILPTAAAACGVSTEGTQPLDGVNLLPFLTNNATGKPHEVLYWKLCDNGAVRKGRWKLYLDLWKGLAKLFDLEKDPAEKNDLSAAEPKVFAEMKALYDAWDKSLPPRAWTNISPVFKK